MKISNIDFIETPLDNCKVTNFEEITGGYFSIGIDVMATAVGNLRAITLARGGVRVFTLSSFGR
jgi:hypothetical protein